jgi:methionyl-tRNA formyltransferase
MRVWLYGSRSFGAAVLGLLLDRGDEVLGVTSPPWRDAELPGYAEGGHRDRLRARAEDECLSWHASRTGPSAEQLPDVDLIVAAHSHDFIGRRTRARARLGAIGYHPSLLPRHRGRDAVRWTIRMGDPVAGGSVYWLGENVDGGDLAAQEWCWVQPGDDASTLWRRDLLPMGVRLIGRVLEDLDAGLEVREPQDEAVATWEPALDTEPLWRPELMELEPAGCVRTTEVRRRVDRGGR